MVWFESVEYPGVGLPAPRLDEDDAFNSNPHLGFITYRVPSIWDLFAAPSSAFDTINVLHFVISVKAPDESGKMRHMECKIDNYCSMKFQKSYTPTLFYLSPPVIYYKSFTELWFDSKATQNLIWNLKPGEMKFINMEIDGSKLDFGDGVTYERHFFDWHKDNARGQVGEMPIGIKNDLKMLWEVGYAHVAHNQSLHCSYDNKHCYRALNVPVIFNMSSNSGSRLGHQNLTIHGHGFTGKNITVFVHDKLCKLTDSRIDSISCEVQPRDTASVTGGYAGSHGLEHMRLQAGHLSYYNFIKELN